MPGPLLTQIHSQDLTEGSSIVLFMLSRHFQTSPDTWRVRLTCAADRRCPSGAPGAAWSAGHATACPRTARSSSSQCSSPRPPALDTMSLRRRHHQNMKNGSSSACFPITSPIHAQYLSGHTHRLSTLRSRYQSLQESGIGRQLSRAGEVSDLHDIDILPREPASQSGLSQFVAAACGLPHQRALHMHRLPSLQARIPANLTALRFSI